MNKTYKTRLFSSKNGFTLAEVLITLGVIGIVAAMTMPTVLVHNRERENTAKLKKVYSTMTQAYTRAVADIGTPDFWDLVGKDDVTGAENIKKVLGPYFTVKPNCADIGGCWRNENTYLLNRTPGPNIGALEDRTFSTFSVVDGMAFAFNVEDKDCKAVFGQTKALTNVCATFIVDVNGDKHPNQFGYDIFKFFITKFGIQPYGSQADEVNPFETSCKSTGDGYGCAAWVVFRDNMDYLHCTGLSWNGKYKCKGSNDSKYNSGS